MEKVENKSCQNSTLEIELRTSKKPRFKAGTELSGKVNKMTVDFIEVQTEEIEQFEVKLQLEMERCVITDSNTCKK
jgi:hypothetical protein